MDLKARSRLHNVYPGLIVAIYEETLDFDARSKLSTTGGFLLEESLTWNFQSKLSSGIENITEWFAKYSDRALTRFVCEIYDISSGVLLATLPMRNFQGRMRLDVPDYISAVIAGAELFSQVESWANDGAHLVIKKRLELQGETGLSEEIARVVMESPRMDAGGTRQSMTLYGYRQTAASVNTVVLGKPKIFRIVAGAIQATFSEVDLYLRTGDTVQMEGQAPFRVGTISYVVSADGVSGMIVGQERT
jgi:hypothetical protein